MGKTEQQHKRTLAMKMNRVALRKLLDAAREHDVLKGGPCDGSSACVNFWCRDDDKPEGYPIACSPGFDDKKPIYTDIIGWVSWQWPEEEKLADLTLTVCPYELYHHQHNTELAPELLESMFRWLTAKMDGLATVAMLRPTAIGTCCPFCHFAVDYDTPLNALIEHIQQQHPRQRIRALHLDGRIETADDTYPLLEATEEENPR